MTFFILFDKYHIIRNIFCFGKRVLFKIMPGIHQNSKGRYDLILFLPMKCAVLDDRMFLVEFFWLITIQSCKHFSWTHMMTIDNQVVCIFGITKFWEKWRPAHIVFFLEISSEIEVLFFRIIHDRIVDCCPFNLYPSNAVRILFMQSQKTKIYTGKSGKITTFPSIIFFIIDFLFFMDLSNRVESCLAFSIFQIHAHQKVEADGKKDNGNYKQNPRYPFSHHQLL